MKKWILLIIIILTVAWLGISYYTQHKGREIPTVAEAPYLVQTFTRVYYAREAYGVSPNVTMSKYYELDGSQWAYHPITIRFNQNTGTVIVTDRRLAK